MILFWLICAGLIAIALAFVLPTLLQRGSSNDSQVEEKEAANVEVYRDQLTELDADLAKGVITAAQYQLDRDEIERRLLDDVATPAADSKVISQNATPAKAPVYAVAFGIPVVAVVLYLMLGHSAAITGATESARTQPAGMTQAGIEANVAALAKRLEQNPDDAQGWSMLARSYLNFEKYSEASAAYAKATSLNTGDADLLIEYAFVLAMTNDRQLAGQPRELINRALQIAPENAKALELAGSAEFQAKNYNEAIRYWQRVLEKSPEGSELARTVQQRIEQAKSLAAGAK